MKPPPAPAHPGIAWAWGGFLLVVFVALASVARLTPPAPTAISAATSEFSAARAWKHLEVIARETHPTGSPYHAVVREYLVSQLRALGFTVEVQSGVLREAPYFSPGQTQPVDNIFAVLPGSGSTGALMLASHYDCAPGSFGASDAGAGVAAILETARIVSAGPPLRNDLFILLSDAEELGLCGAMVFAREHPRAREVALVANFEARGSAGPSVMFETSDRYGRIVAGYVSEARHPCTNSLAYEIYRLLPNDTDMTVFKAAGMAGLNFAFIEGLQNYHTPNDDLAHLDPRTLQHHGENARAVVRAFGNTDLRDLDAPNSVYFDVLCAFVVRYPGMLALPLAILALLGWAVVVAGAARAGAVSFGRLALGFLVALVTAALAAAALWGAYRLGLKLHGVSGFRATFDYASRPGLFCGGMLAALGVFALAVEFPLRRLAPWNLALGAWLVWAILGLAASVWMPGASYLATWPLASALAGAGCALRGQVRLRVAFVLPAAVLFAPTLWLFFLAMTMHMSHALGGLAALSLLFTLPVLEALPSRGRLLGALASTLAGTAWMLAA